jgi:iron complex transport system permease protein
MVRTIGLSRWRSPATLLLGLGIGMVLLLVCLLFSLSLGAADIELGAIYRALTDFDNSTNHLIVRSVRLPRTLIALIVGAALAVAGAVMQGLTQNPLADPGILGVEIGAAFAVIVATFIFNINSLSVYAWFAFLGATIVAVLVYAIATLSPGGVTPLNLTIAGAVFSSLIGTFISGIMIVSQRTLEETRFWLAGSVAGRDPDLLLQVLPYLTIGLVLALVLGRQITTLSLGEDVAKGLGQNTILVKGLGAISVVLLAGGSVAIAGTITQGILRNPLAAPGIIGVNSGASLAAVILLVLFPGAPISLLPPAAFGGGFIVFVLIYGLGWRGGIAPVRLILVGVAFTLIADSFTSILITFGNIETVSSALVWLAGSVYGRTWEQLFVLLPWLVVLCPIALFMAREMNVLNLGDDVARGLGSSVERQRILLLTISVALSGAAVATAGGIGFVDFITPHIARRLVGASHQGLLPVAAVTGGLLVVVADLIGRLLFAPIELPAGLITSAIGAPYFLYLLMQRRRMV